MNLSLTKKSKSHTDQIAAVTESNSDTEVEDVPSSGEIAAVAKLRVDKPVIKKTRADKKVKPNDSKSTSDTEVEETELQKLQAEVQERQARLVTLAVDLKRAQRESASALKDAYGGMRFSAKGTRSGSEVASTSHSAALGASGQAHCRHKDSGAGACDLHESHISGRGPLASSYRATQERGHITGHGAPERCSGDPCLQ